MKRDSKLSAVLHVLLHMAEMDGPATSESLAVAMHTNPVVVRRLMSGLRQAGFVSSAKGHGGGWVLSCSLAAVTLGDIHNAVGSPALQAVNAALDGACEEAEALLLKRFNSITLADLSKDFHRRMTGGGFTHKDIEHAL
jgi:DNA-binding IscR family transcriptional regulator